MSVLFYSHVPPMLYGIMLSRSYSGKELLAPIAHGACI